MNDLTFLFFMNNRSVDLTMVQEGQVVVYRQYLQGCNSTKQQFLHAEVDAKSKKLGFWNQSQPIMRFILSGYLHPTQFGRLELP